MNVQRGSHRMTSDGNWARPSSVFGAAPRLEVSDWPGERRSTPERFDRRGRCRRRLRASSPTAGGLVSKLFGVPVMSATSADLLCHRERSSHGGSSTHVTSRCCSCSSLRVPTVTTHLHRCSQFTSIDSERHLSSSVEGLGGCSFSSSARAHRISSGWVANVANRSSSVRSDPSRTPARTLARANLRRTAGSSGR